MAVSPAMTMLRSMVATSAIHDGERDEKDDYTRVVHPGTREQHLENLKTWANNKPTEKSIEWVKAIAGAGKTALLRSFCAELEEQSGFPSISFFVWKGDARRNTLKQFPATIIYQLSRRIPALVPHIEKVINEDPLLLQSAFKKQMDKLVIRPLLDCCNAIKDELHLIIVVDGIDELDASGQTEFLNFLPHFHSQLSSLSLPISLLVSSRPEDMIVGAFQHPKLASITKATRLGASDEDIWKFLNDMFEDINLRFPYLKEEYGDQWPSHEKRAIMVMQSSGLFIWPTVAINHIDKVENGLGHNARLEQVLSSVEPKPWISSPLDNLYRTILQAHAPQDQESAAFLRFKLRLALLCLPVDAGELIWINKGQVVAWTDTCIRIVFDETLDELWRSVAGLSSLFSPRMPLSGGKSPTPGISHRSLRDFTFSQARCGDKLYYSSEQELHTEVVCKFINFFNTRQAYQNCVEMSAQFIERASDFLKPHLKEAALSEELGRCLDNVKLDAIPPTWPLVAQMYLVVKLFDGLYSLAGNPDFPEGSSRREAFLSKMTMILKNRVASAEGWDTALLRLALSSADFEADFDSYHSVQCWHTTRSSQCTCLHAHMRNLSLDSYQHILHSSALVQHAGSQLMVNRKGDVARDSLEVLTFILSLPDTSQRAVELSPFIPVSDEWILTLIRYCPPNNALYNALGPVCTAALPEYPKRSEDDSDDLVKQFLQQTEAFYKYTERCLKVGIGTNFAPIQIPHDWWQGRETRNLLLRFGYKPPIKIVLDDWWWDEFTRKKLLGFRYRPPFEIPDHWWQDIWISLLLVQLGYQRPIFSSSPSLPTLLNRNPEVSGDVSSRASFSDSQSLPPSPIEPPSIPLSSGTGLDTPAGGVEGAQRVILPTAIPSQLVAHAVAHAVAVAVASPNSAPVGQTIQSGTSGALAGDVADAERAPLSTAIPSQPAQSESAEHTTVPGTNVSVSDVNAQPFGQRRRGGVRALFKRLFRRP